MVEATKFGSNLLHNNNQHDKVIVNFIRNYQSISQSDLIILHTYRQCARVPDAPSLLMRDIYHQAFQILALIAVLICIFLMSPHPQLIRNVIT